MDGTNCTNCPHQAEIEELKRDAERNSSQHKEFYTRFCENETKLAISEERYNNLLTLMTEIKTTVTEIKDKPAKRWDTVVLYIITTIVGVSIGLFFK